MKRATAATDAEASPESPPGSTSSTSIRPPDERPLGLSHNDSARNRTRIEIELRKSVVLQRAILDGANCAIISTDPEGLVWTYNTTAERWLGRSPHEMIGKQTPAVLHDPAELVRRAEQLSTELGQHIAPGFDTLVAKARRGTPDENEWTYIRRDGRRFWVLLSVTTLRDSDGAVAGYLMVSNDISERKRAEEELRQLQLALSNTVDGICRLDTSGHYLQVNGAYAAMVGHAPDEMLGMHWTTTTNPDEHAYIASLVDLMIAEGKADGEITGTRSDGGKSYLQITLITTHDSEQVFSGYFCFSKDISERKRMEAERAHAEEEMRDLNARLQGRVDELKQRNREVNLLSEMGDLLQSCLTSQEAHEVVAQFARQLFQSGLGSIGVLTSSRNLVEAVATWGEASPAQDVFQPEDCWAIRRGRVHVVDTDGAGPVCPHFGPGVGRTICVPMMAQGEALGVLQWRDRPDAATTMESARQLAVTFGEHVALALANFKLRETLRTQSIRDPLTGLFNRRYLDETLERELRRAARHQRPLSVIMVDIDHFKRFNDNFGHEAGDLMMQAVGGLLAGQTRADDVACRYGGEEFTLLLAEATVEGTLRRAAQICAGAKALVVDSHGRTLDPVTLSIGVACFPEHGTTGAALLRAADAALYRAKAEGRDRYILAMSPG